jgi:integrase
MINAYFRIKDPLAKGSRTLYMSVKYSGKNEKYYFGCSISKFAEWDKDNQKVAKGTEQDLAQNKKISECLYRYKAAAREGGTWDEIRQRMEADKTADTKPVKVIKQTFYGLFLELAERCDKPATRANHIAVLDRMKGTTKEEGKYPTLDFGGIDEDFLNEYRKWLKEENPEIKKTTINAYLNMIKKVVIEAVRKKYMKNNPFADGFKMEKISKGDKDAVALTKAEVKRLVDWSATSSRLDRARDWFLIGIFSGLRSEDLMNLNPDKIVNGNTFKLKTSKTGAMFEMPVHPVILQIFKKYGENKFPKPICSQQYNKDLKKLCRLAGLIETGVLATDLSKQLCDCIQSHTSRRSFITIALYEDNIPAATVIKWSLHETESMLWAYAKPRIKDSSAAATEMHKKWELETA